MDRFYDAVREQQTYNNHILDSVMYEREEASMEVNASIKGNETIRRDTQRNARIIARGGSTQILTTLAKIDKHGAVARTTNGHWS
jgi:hypothetical protein